jgi:hypothetical protein
VFHSARAALASPRRRFSQVEARPRAASARPPRSTLPSYLRSASRRHSSNRCGLSRRVTAGRHPCWADSRVRSETPGLRALNSSRVRFLGYCETVVVGAWQLWGLNARPQSAPAGSLNDLRDTEAIAMRIVVRSGLSFPGPSGRCWARYLIEVAGVISTSLDGRGAASFSVIRHHTLMTLVRSDWKRPGNPEKRRPGSQGSRPHQDAAGNSSHRRRRSSEFHWDSLSPEDGGDTAADPTRARRRLEREREKRRADDLDKLVRSTSSTHGLS